MAGLIGLTAEDLELQDAFQTAKWSYDGDWVPHPVVRLTTTLPVAVRDEAADEGRSIQRCRWGFPLGGGRPVGNARDDKLAESRLWSGMLGQGHCLFAATGIYEMVKDDEGRKQSYWFRRRDGRPIVMPGLCREWKVQGEARLCGAIITTAPNDLFARYHDRQVCSLAPGELDGWMAADAKGALDFVHAPADDEWEAIPVDDRIFGKGRREMEDLVPIGEPETIDTDPDLAGRPVASGQKRLDLGGG